ncbi:MAG: 2-oxoglutarate dehydrogenase E1 component [Acidobacteria bacterium]|nr:MAG: 2-oxoglutarate dehydrogenase E1 component [Acidobacteriota bacterium]
MATPDLPVSGHNLTYVEELWARFLDDPSSVGEDWRRFFEQLDGDAPRALAGPAFRPASIFNPPSAAAPAALQPLDDGDVPQLPEAELERRLALFEEVRLFSGVPRAEVALVARLAVEQRLDDGEYLFRVGDPGNTLYLLADGHLEVYRKGHLVVTKNPGDVVGEMSVLNAEKRWADVVAHGPATVLRLDGDVLQALIERRPALARSMVAMLSSRLRQSSHRQDRVNRLIHAYRVRGHLNAQLDPLGSERPPFPELEPEHYGLEEHLDAIFSFSSTSRSPGTAFTLREILELLRSVYCGSIGVQFMHIDDLEAKEWLIERLESPEHHRHLSRDEKLRIFTKLTDAELFEQFIHRKFLGAKRFSLEGAETLIPLLDLALEEAGEQGVREVVIGMAHRGRLNVLVNILGKSPRLVFREFAESGDPELQRGRGDVKYHLGHSSDRLTSGGRQVHLSLCFNPSHLEFVDPVVVGRVRAKQQRFGDRERRRCLGVVIHGDAAVAGQGVVQEMLNMSDLPGFRTGGTLHVVVNNQIGFTTPPELGRSTPYATDVARMLQTPIFHVNGEQPEAVAQVVRLAMDYRAAFGKDVIIDMYCYRRYGHNEGDEPAYTQPLLYDKIRRRKSVRDGYRESLLAAGIAAEEAQAIEDKRRQDLEAELAAARAPDEQAQEGPSSGEGLWRSYRGGPDSEVPEVETGVERQRLSALLRSLTELPEGFHLHPKLKRFIAGRAAMAEGEKPLDWSAAEALAFATLLVDGTPVRLTGQDTPRGTFSHRHAKLVDVKTGEPYVPLQHLAPEQAPCEIWESPLSEVGVLGFEYGYSLDSPDALVAWEAQFGDFCNVAQVIIDQFITSGEDKWRRLSGLVMLLPHGFEGQGPEHSSARLERFLELAAEDNVQVVNLTTPAQYFHCLRRQVLRPWRKPLVVMSPKSLLRHPEAVSPLDELADGGFQRIIPDGTDLDPGAVRKILLTSGKLYYELAAARRERGVRDVAIVRLEQYYPLAQDRLAAALAPYPAGTPLVWVQEEPCNMGAWSFLRLRLEPELVERWPLERISRPESASPATGSAAAHQLEQSELIDRALA